MCITFCWRKSYAIPILFYFHLVLRRPTPQSMFDFLLYCSTPSNTQLAGNDLLDDHLREICETWIIAHLLSREHQHLVLPKRAWLFDITTWFCPTGGGSLTPARGAIWETYGICPDHFGELMDFALTTLRPWRLEHGDHQRALG